MVRLIIFCLIVKVMTNDFLSNSNINTSRIIGMRNMKRKTKMKIYYIYNILTLNL